MTDEPSPVFRSFVPRSGGSNLLVRLAYEAAVAMAEGVKPARSGVEITRIDLNQVVIQWNGQALTITRITGDETWAFALEAPSREIAMMVLMTLA